MSEISIKQHHFVGIFTALGDVRAEFQPHPYGHAVHTVARNILSNRDIELRITMGAEDIYGEMPSDRTAERQARL